MSMDRAGGDGSTIVLWVLFCLLKRRVAVVHPKQIDINQNGMYISPDKRKNIENYQESKEG